MKTVTPVRRSRSGRPGAAGAGEDVPVLASMELLPPEAVASSPSISAVQSSTSLADHHQGGVPLGAPASLQQQQSLRGPQGAPVRRSSSAQARDAPVVQLSSTRPAADRANSLQGQQIGALLQHLPSGVLAASASLTLPLAAGAPAGASQAQLAMARGGSLRYGGPQGGSVGGSAATASLSLQPSSSAVALGTGGATPTLGHHPGSLALAGMRPLSASSTASSMLVGGVPGPLPAQTPAGMGSRAWTPLEEVCGSELDDSANTRASTASTSMGGRGAGPGGGGYSVASTRMSTPAVVGHAHSGAGDGDGGASMAFHDEAHGEFYRYLESRRATDEGMHEDGADPHAFTVPDMVPDDLSEPWHSHHDPSALRASTTSTTRQSTQHQQAGSRRPRSGQQQAQHAHPALRRESGASTTAGGASSSQAIRPQPSEAERPGTAQSVASGVLRQSGGVFFTALRRSFGEGEGPLAYEESVLSARSGVTEAMSLVSHANPMQEPSSARRESATPTADAPPADPPQQQQGEEDDGDVSEREDPELASYVNGYDPDEECSKSVWDNPVQTPRDTSAATPAEEPSRASFLSLLRDLYSDTGAAGRAADGGDATPAPSQPDDPQEHDEHDEDRDGAEEEEDADLRGSMGAVDEILAAQEARRLELSAYMANLQEKLDAEGHALVELPKNYQVIVEQLIMAKRAEYASLKGWLGPRRFAELPINNLPDSHEDPKVAEGLNRIRALDGKLAEKEAEAIILARERDPEGFAAAERARLARQAAAVEDALKRERMRRMRQAKLARALTPPAGGEGAGGEGGVRASSALSVASSRAGATQRLLQLRPDEEALVEAVLRRDEDKDERVARNPFELSGDACLPPAAATAGAAGGFSFALPPPLPGAAGSRPQSALGRGGQGLAPLAFSAGLGGLGGAAEGAAALQGEASAAQLLRMAHQVALGLAGGVGQEGGGGGGIVQGSKDGGGGAPAGRGSGAGEGEASTVDLAAGLAVHTRALLRAQQAAVAGMPLGAINAHLERFAMEHRWGHDGGLADFSGLAAGAGAAGYGRAGAGAPAQLAGEPSQARSAAAAAAVAAPAAVAVAAQGEAAAAPKRDYLREEREAKELHAREADLDARIRAFKTSDPAGKKLTPDQLSALVDECLMQQQHLAKLAQQQQQHQPAAAATAPSAASVPPPPKGVQRAPSGASGNAAASTSSVPPTPSGGGAARRPLPPASPAPASSTAPAAAAPAPRATQPQPQQQQQPRANGAVSTSGRAAAGQLLTKRLSAGEPPGAPPPSSGAQGAGDGGPITKRPSSASSSTGQPQQLQVEVVDAALGADAAGQARVASAGRRAPAGVAAAPAATSQRQSRPESSGSAAAGEHGAAKAGRRGSGAALAGMSDA